MGRSWKASPLGRSLTFTIADFRFTICIRNRPRTQIVNSEPPGKTGPTGTLTAAQPTSKAKVFLRRLTSSVVLWSVILAALFSGNKLISDYVFLLIMVFLAGFGLAEFYGLVEKRDLVCFKTTGLLGGLLLMVGTFLNVTGYIGTQGSP